MTIANTILNQLGGSKFVAMTGARNLMDCGNALSFKLPRGAENGINYIKIELTTNDDYNMTFGKVRGLDYSVIATVKGAYCDNLVEMFRYQTGLDTHL